MKKIENEFLEELKKSTDLIREELSLKRKILEEEWNKNYGDKLEIFHQRIKVTEESNVLESISYILNNSWYFHNFKPLRELESIIFFPDNDKTIKEFEIYSSVLDEVIKYKCYLSSIIEFTSQNIQIKLYRQEDAITAGKVEILKDENVVFEADCFDDGVEIRHWVMNQIYIVTEIDWISSILELHQLLLHARADDELRSKLSKEELLIKKNKL